VICGFGSGSRHNGRVKSFLITAEGAGYEVNPPTVRRLLDSGERFWLDFTGLDQAGVALLREEFGFHPLAVEDAEHFGQRPKLDSYDGYALVVVFGVNKGAHLAEVHCFYSEKFLVTVHRAALPELNTLAERLRQRPELCSDHVMMLYRVVDTLVDAFFPVLAGLDDRIDRLEDEILRRPTDQQLGTLFDIKRSLIALRKVLTPQRDMFAMLLSGGSELPGMTADAERYFRDLYDHMIRISDLVDSYRDLISGVMDTHLSTVSNRLNVVMKQLAIIATVFLPLSFLTGFFGQNFGWMVNRLGSLPIFLAIGVGLPIAVAVALFVLFRRRGWLSADGTVPAPGPAVRATSTHAERWHRLHTGS
jgi:magnesium transporter